MHDVFAMHDAFAIGIPVLVILAGILLNKQDHRELWAEVNRRFDAVDAELRYFHGTIGKLEGRLQSLEGRS